MAKAKPMSKTEVAGTLADKVGITKKQVTQLLEELAELAYKQAKNTFVVPGIGKLVLADRKARVGRNPATGEVIQIPAKRVVKFRIAKAAKDAILGKK
jgi:DNA-binding protein HU-beta